MPHGAGTCAPIPNQQAVQEELFGEGGLSRVRMGNNGKRSAPCNLGRERLFVGNGREFAVCRIDLKDVRVGHNHLAANSGLRKDRIEANSGIARDRMRRDYGFSPAR
jgi:hypothetical protein